MTVLAKKMKEAVNIPSKRGFHADSQILHYDYDLLSDEQDIKWLKNLAVEIKIHYVKALSEICHVGEVLLQAKERLAHGTFMSWVYDEFVLPGYFSLSSCNNYMVCAREVRNHGYKNIQKFSLAAFYLLSKAKDSEVITEYLVEQAEGKGEKVSRNEVRRAKKRLAVINEKGSFTKEQKKNILETDLSKKTLDNLSAEKIHEISVTTVTPEIKDHLLDLESETEDESLEFNSDYNYGDKKFDLVFIQDNLYMERPLLNINTAIVKVSKLTRTVCAIIDPLKLTELEAPKGFSIKGLIFCKRGEKRINTSLDLVQHLMCIVIVSKVKKPLVILEDFHQYFSDAVSDISRAYANRAKGDERVTNILFTHSGIELPGDMLLNPSLMAQLKNTLNCKINTTN